MGDKIADQRFSSHSLSPLRAKGKREENSLSTILSIGENMKGIDRTRKVDEAASIEISLPDGGEMEN
jgi:hypothetical protein